MILSEEPMMMPPSVDSNYSILCNTWTDSFIRSAAALQYLQDPFVKLFVKRPIRRSPIINRGEFFNNDLNDRLVKESRYIYS